MSILFTNYCTIGLIFQRMHLKNGASQKFKVRIVREVFWKVKT